MKRILLLVLTCISMQLQAQNQITGLVKDDAGEVLIGAGVMIKGTTQGVITDLDGKYILSVPNNATTLVFSHMSAETKEVAIAGKSVIDMVLKNTATQLGEVVVTALGIKRDKKALGYSVQSVSGDDLNSVSSVSPLTALAGTVSGLNVTGAGSGPGGSVKMIIRGANSITGNNEPLYVVDGVPLDNTTVSSADVSGGFDYGNAANNINPDDIESVSVLKGGAAAALYGSRGQNGVVMITTKSGKKGEKLDVNYKTSLTFSQMMMKPKFQTDYSQGAAGKHLLNETQSWGAKMNGQEYVNFLGQNDVLSTNTENPFDEFYKTGTNYSNTVSINKGLENGSIYMSASNLASKGIVPKEQFDKLSLNFRVNYALTKYLNVDAKANFISQTGKNRPNLMESPDNPVYALYHLPRSIRMSQLDTYETLGGYPVIFNQLYDTNASGGVSLRPGSPFEFAKSPYVQNPNWTVNNNTNEDNRKRFVGFAKFDFNIKNIIPSIPLDNFNLMVRGGIDYYVDRRRNQVHDKTNYKPSGNAVLKTYKGDFKETNFDFLLSGLKKLENFTLSASVGGNIRHNESYGTTANSESGIINPYGGYVIQNFNQIQTTEGITEREIQSVYAMFTADYRGKVFLDVTGRSDWSSTLAPKNNPFTYTSYSLSWLLSETFDLPREIGYLKLRGSWAEVGNDLGPGQLYYTYTVNSNQYYGLAYGGVPSVKPNYNILPEKTRSFELGLEARFFTGRLRTDFAYYSTGTRNQIFAAPLANSSGFEKGRINSGYIANKGLELSISGDIIKNETFTLSANANISRNFAKVEELAESLDVLTVGGLKGVGIQVKRDEIPGMLVGTSYARDEQGNIKLDAKNLPMQQLTENGTIENQSMLGNSMPKWIAGAGLSFRYKNIVGDVFFDGKFGHKLYSYSNAYGSQIGALENTIAGRDQWEMAKTVAGQIGVNPIDVSGKSIYGSKDGVAGSYFVDPQEYYKRVAEINEEYMYDASFIRMQRVSLGYKFDKGLIQNVGLKGLTVSLVANNLFYLLKHTKNVTPNSAFNGGTFGGIELFSYPEMRTFGFSVNFDL